MTSPSLAEAFGRRVPRYTSYPTAPHFHDGVTAGTYARWLGELPRPEALSLYLHIPFCQQLCWYCGCHTRVAGSYGAIERYRDALLAEIGLVEKALGRRAPVSHIHWGGGTPTTLTPADFQRLHDALDEAFDIASGAEIAVEIDPRTLIEAMVDRLARSRVTRVSFGVQDFAPEVQAAINRVQPFDMTRRAVERLRAAGVSSINLDLVYGLPRQTEDSLRRTIELTVSLAPDRVALFGYAHVPWMKRHQRLIREAELPDLAARWRQATLAATILVEAGYVQIGIDHFARPGDPLAVAAGAGRLRRNFQGYTDDGSGCLIGLGASAISSLPQGYAQNTADIPKWLGAVEAARLGTARGFQLTADDRQRRAIIERLMCDLRVDLAEIVRPATAAALLEEASPTLGELQRLGVASVNGRVVQVAAEARPLARLAAAAFDRYLPAAPRQYSIAV